MTALKLSGRKWLAGAGLSGFIAVLLYLPFRINSFYVFVLSLTIVYAIATMGYDLLVGSCGQVSMAHPIFFAAGGYSAAIVSEHGLSPWLGLLVGIGISVAIAFATGLVGLRLNEFYFALVTLGIVLALQSFLIQAQSLTGGSNGISSPPLTFIATGYGPGTDSYITILLFAIVAAVLVYRLQRSHLGRAMNGVRDISRATQSCGINIFRVKMTAYVLSAVFAAIAGAFYGGILSALSPDQFGLDLVVTFLAMSVVGGRGSIGGALLGAAVFTIIPQELQATESAQGVAFGLLIMLTILLAPGGLWSLGKSLTALSMRTLSRMTGRTPNAAAQAVELVSDIDEQASGELLDGWTATAADGVTAVARAAGPEQHPHPELPLLTVRGVVKKFGELTALSDVDLSIDKGEILGLIGPNGSGKTTLLNCISRLYTINAGDIRLSGVNITSLRPDQVARLGIRRTYQSPQLIGDRTVLDNVMLGAYFAYAGTAEDRNRGRATGQRQRAAAQAAREALAFLGLEKYESLRVDAIAGPTQKLLEVARCLAARPRLILLDEVASGINSFERAYLLDRIREIREVMGVTFVVIEHDIEFVNGLADRLLVLNAGRVLAHGLPDDVLSDRDVIEAYIGG